MTLAKQLALIFVVGSLAVASGIWLITKVDSPVIFNLIFNNFNFSKNNPDQPVKKFIETVSSENTDQTKLAEITNKEQVLITKTLLPIPPPSPEKPLGTTPAPNLKAKVVAGVPFITQAPLGEWDDPRQKYGCEEALMLMAWHWIKGWDLESEFARDEIIEMSEWQDEKYGNFYDTSIADTTKVFKNYFDYHQLEIINDATEQDIKTAIDNDYLVFVPVDGRQLDNPYFKPPGPFHHMLMVKGYNDYTGHFITNEPGTINGHNFLYSYQNLMTALRDYPTGFEEPTTTQEKTILVVKR